MSGTTAGTERVYDLVRQHQSIGRVLLYRMAGELDLEVEAAGCWVTGASGRRYLDLGSYAVFLLGHRHPRVIAAVQEQLARLPGSSRAFPSEVNARAAAAVADIAPLGLSKVLLLNSGAEAVEAAIKLARAVTRRRLICHLEGSFHGKTAGALSLTDAAALQDPFRPLLPDVARLSRTDPEAAAHVIRAKRPAAVFIEPVQGEGGVFEVSTEYLRAVRQACDDTGALLVADEVQCGLGRCGVRWVTEAARVTPDVLLTGKALGGGVVPVSALAATPKAFAPFDRDPFLHTSTFGGNPLASAAVVATIEAIESEDVPRLAAALGAACRGILQTLARAWPELFAAVSGRGLLLGLHCRRPEIAGEFIRACLQEQVLVTPCLTTPSVVRFTPPAVLTPSDLAFANGALNAAASRTAQALLG